MHHRSRALRGTERRGNDIHAVYNASHHLMDISKPTPRRRKLGHKAINNSRPVLLV
jgi:hypothetical protein